MLVKIVDNKIQGIIKISSINKEQEYLEENPEYKKTTFNFVEAIDLYEYDEVNTTFKLIKNWETIKAEKEAQLQAEFEAQLEAQLPTLEKLKAIKIAKLNKKVNEQYKAYLDKYPEIEIESFKDKAKESALVIADNNVALIQTPYLSNLTGNTTIEARNTLAFAVNVKVQETAQIESYAVSKRDEIKACTTVEQLEAIEI